MHERLLFNRNFLEDYLRQYLGAWFYSYRMEELKNAALLSSHGRQGTLKWLRAFFLLSAFGVVVVECTHISKSCHLQQGSSEAFWLWSSISVVHGSLALCLSFLEPQAPLKIELVRKSSIKLVALLLWPVRLTVPVNWESTMENIFPKSYWDKAFISFDWILLPWRFRVLHGLVGIWS